MVCNNDGKQVIDQREKNKTILAMVAGILGIVALVMVLIAIGSAMLLESEGLLFLMMIPAVILVGTSEILSIISVIFFIVDKKNKVFISKKRFIFSIINIFVVCYVIYSYLIKPIILFFTFL